jgi:predicted permease
MASTRTSLFDQSVQDARFALRVLRRTPTVTAAALLVLGIGIGATTVMFTVINSVVLAPLAFPDPARLVAIHTTLENGIEATGFSVPDFQDVRAQSRSLQLVAWADSGGTLSDPGDPEYVESRGVSANFFTVLGVQLPLGRSFRDDDDRDGAAPVAIISERLWQRRFGGDATVLGRRLVFGGTAYDVIGVAPAPLRLNGDADVFVPLSQITEVRTRNRNRLARFMRVFARLRGTSTVDEAQSEIAVIARRLATAYPASNGGVGMRVRPLQADVIGDVAPTLWLLLLAVGAVLLIACVNIASLLLARTASRGREFAVRAALGASRSRLTRQGLTESAVLAAGGGLLGAGLALVGVQPLLSLWPGTLPRAAEIRPDLNVWLFIAAISGVSSLLFGIIPVLRLRVLNLVRTLRGGARTIAGGSHALHSALVVAEVAIAVALLVSAGVLARSFVSLSKVDPGIDVHNVLTGRLALSPTVLANPDQILSTWNDVLDRARRLPGVQAAALVDTVPMRGGINPLPYSTTPDIPEVSKAAVALASAVTPDYVAAIGLRLRRGRFIDGDDRAGSAPVIVIDERLAHRAFGTQDPIGKPLWVPSLGPAPSTVVGVVDHVRHWGLAADDSAQLRDQLYYPFAQVPTRLMRLFSSFMSVVVRTEGPPATIEGALRAQLRGLNHDQALYGVRTMEQVAAGTLNHQQFLATLFAIFAALAVVLACIGIYGVLSYVAGRRVPEFGVRMALGASSHSVMSEVLRHSASMVSIGVLLGAGGAWVAGRSIAQVVQGVQPAQPVTALAMIAVLVVAALAASAAPAWRASRTDPLQVLRQD